MRWHQLSNILQINNRESQYVIKFECIQLLRSMPLERKTMKWSHFFPLRAKHLFTRIYLLTDCRDDLRDDLIDYGLPDICLHEGKYRFCRVANLFTESEPPLSKSSSMFVLLDKQLHCLLVAIYQQG